MEKQTDEKKNLNIYQKLLQIGCYVGVIQKNKSGFNYKYCDKPAILEKLTPALLKYGVCLLPSIVPGTFKVNKLIKTTYNVHSRSALQDEMSKTGIGFSKLETEYKINERTLSSAVKGRNISLKCAERIAKIYGKNVNELFVIEEQNEPYAYETTHQIKRCVRAVLSLAKRQMLIENNYASAEYVSYGKKPSNEIKCLNEDNAKILYAALNDFHDIRYKTAIMILLMTGLRRGELCGLEWKDINFENKTISIKRSLIVVASVGVILKETKTKKSERTLSLPDILLKQLIEYKVWQDNYKKDLGDKWVELDRLFTDENGNRIYPGTIDSWLDKILKLSGLEHVTIHSLRHTNITMQILSGVPLVIVSGRAGHSKTSTTADVYSHFTKSGDEHAAETINNIFMT